MTYKKDILFGCLAAVIITIGMAIYASHLNDIFYSHFAPFYDSNGYFLSLLETINLTKHDDLKAALNKAIRGSGPTALPFLEAIFLAPMIKHPSRSLAAWIQLPWLTCFALSLFVYFRSFRKKTTSLSLLLMIPFISIASLWNYNGGLSDFRMDLLLYLLLGTSFVWFLVSRHTKSYWAWGFSGLFLGLTCLARVTTPVYAFICVVPLLLLRLIFIRPVPPQKTLFGFSIAIGIASIVSGWFYILNFNSLYHYYFIWNTDANAGLSVRESATHFVFSMKNIGAYSLTMALFFFFFGIIKYFSRKNQKSSAGVELLSKLDWESLWLGAAPIAFLIVRGAGLNPFVVMPSAFGLIMFLVSPCLLDLSREDESKEYPSSILRGMSLNVASLFILSLFILSALRGIDHHLKPLEGNLFPNMQPLQFLIQLVAEDSGNRGQVVMASSYISGINDTTLENILKFDLPQFAAAISFPSMGYPPESFNRIQSASDWESILGSSELEKIDHLVNQVNKNVNYIFLPDDASIENIRPKHPYVITNRHIGEIKDRLLTLGNWFPIGQPEQIDHDEKVQAYRNQNLVF